MPRKYQHTQKLLPQIKEMLNQGMTQKEIEKILELTGDRPVHNLLKRERKKNFKEFQTKEGGNLQKLYKNTTMKTNA